MTVTETIQETVGSTIENVTNTAESSLEQAKTLLPSSESPSQPTTASRASMSEARLPLQYRDSCAHLLIPLNRCRFEEYYLPWKCETERHSYEKCQYDEFKKRVAKMDEIRAAKGGARSN